MPADCLEDRARTGVRGRRRKQIVDTARACFIERGFHAAGMSMIARQAGLSVGTIYHLFTNKEELIAAIVGEDLDQVKGLMALADTGMAPEEAISQFIERTIEQLGRGAAVLRVEVMADASRNPRMAELVQEADRTLRDYIFALLMRFDASLSPENSGPELATRIEMLLALMGGAMVRMARNPEVQFSGLKPMVATILGR
ncbi:MAG: TetR/AcrR family transcriptional regulator [Azoarcus sp.]|nr:TetR/AcrR family transcriptional regulator [Azoarcus sp.]